MGISITSRTMLASTLKSMTGPKALVLNASLNYVAVAIAGFFNCSLMRYKETKSGIDITNENQDVVYGKSKAAGVEAVKLTAYSRMVLPIMPIGLPLVTVALLT